MIRLLTERGEIIKNEEWPKLKKIDDKINHQKDEHLDKFVTPTSVFVTFECEEGVNRALNFDSSVETDSHISHLRELMPRSSTSGE
jgi:hypothetical protein